MCIIFFVSWKQLGKLSTRQSFFTNGSFYSGSFFKYWLKLPILNSGVCHGMALQCEYMLSGINLPVRSITTGYITKDSRASKTCSFIIIDSYVNVFPKLKTILFLNEKLSAIVRDMSLSFVCTPMTSLTQTQTIWDLRKRYSYKLFACTFMLT